MSNIPEFLPDEAHVAIDPGAHSAAKTAAPAAAAPNHGRFGPSRLYAFWIIAFNPFSWVAIFLASFTYSAHFRKFLYDLMAGLPFVQVGMKEFFVWQKTLPLSLWWIPAAIMLIYMTARITTTHYHITDDGILTIRHGLFSLRSPGGPFAQYVDTIPMGLVLDVDLMRGLTEMVIGTGTLSLHSREAATGGRALLRHVPKAEKARQLLMSHSPARDARVIVSG